MMLGEIKYLFKESREMSLSEIQSRVNADMGLVEHAVKQLVAKGFLVEVNYESECRGCSMKCSSRGERVFRLAGKP